MAATALFGVAALTAGNAAVADPLSVDDPLKPIGRFYVGVSGGVSRDDGDYRFDGARVVSSDVSGTGLKLTLGVRLIKYLGLEVAYAKVSNTELVLTDNATGATSRESFSHDAVPFTVVGFLPIGDRLELVGRAGLVINSSYQSGGTCFYRSRNGFTYSRPCTDTPFTWGLGARWALNEHLGLRADWDSIELRDRASAPASELSLFTVGVDWRF